MHRTFQVVILSALLVSIGCQHNRARRNAYVQQGQMNTVYSQPMASSPHPQLPNTNTVAKLGMSQVPTSPEKLAPIPVVPPSEEAIELPVVRQIPPPPSL